MAAQEAFASCCGVNLAGETGPECRRGLGLGLVWGLGWGGGAGAAGWSVRRQVRLTEKYFAESDRSHTGLVPYVPPTPRRSDVSGTIDESQWSCGCHYL